MAAPAQLRAAVAVLHAQAGDDFFGDTAEARTVAELRELGLPAELAHVHYPRGDEAAAAALDDQFAQWLAATGKNVVVFGQIWRESLIEAAHRAGALVISTDANGQFARDRPDVLLAHFPQNRAPLVQLLQVLAGGGDLLRVPNLLLTGDSEWPSAAAPQPFAPAQATRHPFAAATQAVVFGSPANRDGSPPVRRKTLDTNSGCPFSDDAARNPQFAGVPMPADVAGKGCSFCPMGGDYRALPVGDTVAAHLEQIAYWQRAARDEGQAPVQEFVIRDQAALRYLPQLVQACVDSGLPAAGLLVPGRGDAILRYGDQLRQAAELCSRAADAGQPWWFTIHLVGFESFSQDQLDLYNKGVTVAQYAQALEHMRALHRADPRAFRLYAHGASSFILFNPWTTLHELQQTAQFCSDHAVGELAHGLTLTRLRLYPNLPLYWKAKHEGLLTAEPPQPDRGAAFTGYAAEAAWRYCDGRTAVAEELLRALADDCNPAENVGLLQSVVRWALAQMPDGADAETVAQAAQAVPAIARDWRQLRALWRQPAATGAAGGSERTVVAGRHCNNRCRTCTADRSEFNDDPAAVARQVAAAAQSGQVVFAGREPTLLPQWPKLVRAARVQGALHVEAVSNGRLAATAGVAERLRGAGLGLLTIKRHRLDDAQEDAIADAAGAGQQGAAAMARCRAAGLPFALLWLPVPEGWDELPAVPAWALRAGAREVRVRLLAGEVDWAGVPRLQARLAQMAQAAEASGVRWSIEGP